MTDVLVKLFVKNYEDVKDSRVRESYGTLSSFVGMACNIGLFVLKFIMGTISNSVAVTSDAFNNLSDCMSCIVTLASYKLAAQPADKDHPFGHGRIEYMTSLIVSAIVLYAGITALVESVKKIIHPEVADYSTVTLIILIAGIIVKFILGIYVKKKGKDVHSDSLVASGSDAFNDAILSIFCGLTITLFFAELSPTFRVTVDIPVFTPVTSPFLFTVAMDLLLDENVGVMSTF